MLKSQDPSSLDTLCPELIHSFDEEEGQELLKWRERTFPAEVTAGKKP